MSKSASSNVNKEVQENLAKSIEAYKNNRKSLLNIYESTQSTYTSAKRNHTLEESTQILLNRIDEENFRRALVELNVIPKHNNRDEIAVQKASSSANNASGNGAGAASNVQETEDPEKLTKSITEQDFILENPCLAVMGQTKSGKSTFINILLKQSVVAQDSKLCTSRITKLTYSPVNILEEIYPDGQIKQYQLKKPSIPAKFVNQYGDQRRNAEAIKVVIRGRLKCRFLKCGLDLIDSPGLNENPELTEVSKNMVKDTLPIIIYVIDGRNSVTEDDVMDIRTLKKDFPNIVIIYFVTKLDPEEETLRNSPDMDILGEARQRMLNVYKRLQYYSFISPKVEMDACPIFHGTSLWKFFDYLDKKVNDETKFHADLYAKFQRNLYSEMKKHFDYSVEQASKCILDFHMDVLSRIIQKAALMVNTGQQQLKEIEIMRKREKDMFEHAKDHLANNQQALLHRMVDMLVSSRDQILEPMRTLKYPIEISSKLPDVACLGRNAIDTALIKECRMNICDSLCTAIDTEVKSFIDNEFFAQHWNLQHKMSLVGGGDTNAEQSNGESAQSSTATASASATNENDSNINKSMRRALSEIQTGTSGFQIILQRMLVRHYDIDDEGVPSNKERQKRQFTNDIFSLIKSWFRALFSNIFHPSSGGGGQIVDVTDESWKYEQAAQYYHRLNKDDFVKKVFSKLYEDFEEKHRSFVSALDAEEKLIQINLSASEKHRTALAEYAPDFAGLLMLTLDVRGKTRLSPDNVKQLELIGEGAQGKVYKCEFEGQLIAKKETVLPIDQMNDIALEVYYSYFFSHPRLLPLIGVQIDDTKDHDIKKISVYAPLKCIDAAKLLKTYKPALPIRMNIGLQVAEALCYLHREGIMHRDLKLANILLDEELNAFMADYGFCKSVALSSVTFVGTPVHIAPEIVQKQTYDYKVDVYSFGVLLWYLFEGTGRHPKFARYQANVGQVLWAATHDNKRPERLEHMSNALWQMLEHCWHSDAEQRPTIFEAMASLEKILTDENMMIKKGGSVSKEVENEVNRVQAELRKLSNK